jgi:hypothetical protein
MSKGIAMTALLVSTATMSGCGSQQSAGTAALSDTRSGSPSSTLSPSGAVTGGITGRVIAGPSCPVERINAPCPPKAVAMATVSAVPLGGGAGTSVVSGADGSFALALRPGTYTLNAPGRWPKCAPVVVTVTSHLVRHDLLCDTGIR